MKHWLLSWEFIFEENSDAYKRRMVTCGITALL